MTSMAERSDVRRRMGAIAAVLVLIGLPLVLAGVEAVRYHVRNRSNGTIVSSGVEREYLLYVPRSYDRSRPTPLVISLHGGSMWPAAQMRTSQWNRVADEHGFIVVYPSGVSGRGPRAWRAGGSLGSSRDVQFIAELIDTLRAGYNIDSTMVFADGLSNGGGMAFLLSCTLSDRIAAVGVVGVAVFLPWSECTNQRAVPMIAFHGTADRFAWYHGGTSWVAPPRPVSGHLEVDGDVGAAKPVQRNAGGFRRDIRCHSPRLLALCRRRGRGPLHRRGRRPYMARRRPDAGVVRRAHYAQHRRVGRNVGVLS